MRALIAFLFTINSFIAFAEVQEYGLASVYSATFQGKRTASGEIFNHNDLTAAHQKFPFGSLVRVTRLDNGKSVVVRIIDRGPFVSQRVTDLSKAAAIRLGVNNENEEVRVKLELLPNRVAEVSPAKERSPTKDSQNGTEQPFPAPSSGKVEINSKSVEQPAVLKEYKHVPNNRTVSVQKKSLK